MKTKKVGARTQGPVILFNTFNGYVYGTFGTVKRAQNHKARINFPADTMILPLQLIAAAPAMLEALKTLKADILHAEQNGVTAEGLNAMFGEAREAIIKATELPKPAKNLMSEEAEQFAKFQPEDRAVIERIRGEFPNAFDWNVNEKDEVEILNFNDDIIGYITTDQLTKIYNKIEA